METHSQLQTHHLPRHNTAIHRLVRRAEIRRGFLGLTLVSLKCFISALPLHTTRSELASACVLASVPDPPLQHIVLGVGKEPPEHPTPRAVPKISSQAAPRQCLLQEGGTAPSLGCPGQSGADADGDKAGLGLPRRQLHEPHQGPAAHPCGFPASPALR